MPLINDKVEFSTRNEIPQTIAIAEWKGHDKSTRKKDRSPPSCFLQKPQYGLPLAS